ncbi:MAG: transglutaminase-like domain-containing protein [Planctomycetaceae bacterium]
MQGFLPTSGGDGGSDSYAMGGIGNGDALVLGKENVQTFAPIDDAPFREKMTSQAYSMHSANLTANSFKPKNTDRSVAPAPEQSKSMIPELNEEMRTMQESGREFSTLRREGMEKRNDIESTKSKAIFHVVGRVPLHLRMETYDYYDGISLISASESKEPLQCDLVEEDELHWLEPHEQTAYDFFSPEETHVLKIVGVDANVIPTPLHWTGSAIKDVNVRNFYREGQYRVIHLDRDSLPDLVPIHIRSRVLDERYFDGAQVLYSGFIPRSNTLPDSPEMERIKKLAIRITAGCTRNREKVNPIVNYLREHYQHDNEHQSTDSGEFDKTELSISRFLFDTKSGTDYEFATATMLLLRSLNISSRVVSGFYVDPDNYDRKKDHTSVYTNNIHFWCEVHLGGNVWNTLEPTPGYEKLAPPLSFFERIQYACVLLIDWLSQHLLALSVFTVCVGSVFWKRRPVMAFLWYWDLEVFLFLVAGRDFETRTGTDLYPSIN